MGKGERKKRAAGKIKINRKQKSKAVQQKNNNQSSAAIIATQYFCGA
jgi:hypothetical protein